MLIDPLRFDWSDRAVVEGHAWLLLAGFSWALAILHARRHRWRLHAARRAALADVGGDRPALDPRARSSSPRGHLDFSQPDLWIGTALYRRASPARPATWAAVSVARALPPVTGSLGMLGTPLLGIASSVVLVGEPMTWPLVLGTMLVIAGIAIVIRGESEDELGNDEPRRTRRGLQQHRTRSRTAPSSTRRASRRRRRSGKAHPKHLDLRYGPRERNTWDLFPAADPNAPCLVFIHGGYWQRNSRTSSPA